MTINKYKKCNKELISKNLNKYSKHLKMKNKNNFIK